MIEATRQFIAAGDDESAMEAFEVFDDLVGTVRRARASIAHASKRRLKARPRLSPELHAGVARPQQAHAHAAGAFPWHRTQPEPGGGHAHPCAHLCLGRSAAVRLRYAHARATHTRATHTMPLLTTRPPARPPALFFSVHPTRPLFFWSLFAPFPVFAPLRRSDPRPADGRRTCSSSR